MEMSIGSVLRKLRNSLNLTQQDISNELRKIGINANQPSIACYESDKVIPSAKILLWYAEMFDVSLDYIYGRTENPTGALYKCEPKLLEQHALQDKIIDGFLANCFKEGTEANVGLHKLLESFLKERVDKSNQVSQSTKEIEITTHTIVKKTVKKSSKSKERVLHEHKKNSPTCYIKGKKYFYITQSTVLRDLRVEAGLSLRKLAADFGVRHQKLYTYECRAIYIPEEILLKYTEVFNLTITEILEKANQTKIPFTGISNEVKLGYILQALRLSERFSQKDLSDVLRLNSNSSVSRYERGIDRPPLHTMHKYAKYFNMTIQEICDKAQIPWLWEESV